MSNAYKDLTKQVADEKGINYNPGGDNSKLTTEEAGRLGGGVVQEVMSNVDDEERQNIVEQTAKNEGIEYHRGGDNSKLTTEEAGRLGGSVVREAFNRSE